MRNAGRSAGSSVLSTGDPADASLTSVIHEHSGAVYRLARSIVRDPGLADDVTQETFIKVWKHQAEFRGDGSMRGWILRIAHREAITVLRRSRDNATDPNLLETGADWLTPAREVEGRQAADAFRVALDELDELSRAILVLREIEGMAYDEIAATLDVPVSTVKSRLLRARRQLAVKLEGWRQ